MFDDFLGRLRGGNQETLNFVTFAFAQECHLFFGFHTFCNDLKAKIVAHNDDGSRNRGIIGIDCHVPHKGSINLDRIDRQPFQIGEGRIACPEIINGNLQPRMAADFLISCIITVSVTSRTMRAAGVPVSVNIRDMVSVILPSISCRGDRLIAIGSGGTDCASHSAIWRQTSAITHSPILPIRPVSSATGINCIGEI